MNKLISKQVLISEIYIALQVCHTWDDMQQVVVKCFVSSQYWSTSYHSIKQDSQNKCCEGVMTGFSTMPVHIGQTNVDGIRSRFTKNSWSKPMINRSESLWNACSGLYHNLTVETFIPKGLSWIMNIEEQNLFAAYYCSSIDTYEDGNFGFNYVQYQRKSVLGRN